MYGTVEVRSLHHSQVCRMLYFCFIIYNSYILLEQEMKQYTYKIIYMYKILK